MLIMLIEWSKLIMLNKWSKLIMLSKLIIRIHYLN